MRVLHRSLAFQFSLITFICLSSSNFSVAEDTKTLRIGIIGCDTSHASSFSKILNNPQTKYEEFKHVKWSPLTPKGAVILKKA